jgi:LacI family transcriptional regulator
MLGGLEQSSRTGCELLLEKCSGLASQKKAVDRLVAQGIDGVILPPPLCDSRPTIQMLAKQGVTVVALATARPIEQVSSVRIDDYQGALAMTRYLIGLGHTKIAFIKGNPLHTPAELRYVGFKSAMEEANLKVLPEWVAPGLFTYRSGLTAAEMLLKRPGRPTAIFASNDDMAAAAIAVAHGLKLQVPEALTVCGFDDTPVASTIWPELTTIHQPIAALGRAAVSILVGQIKRIRTGEPVQPVHQMMKFTLIERGSSAKPGP